MMTNAVPLPGAMMNHFVIANWYNADNEFDTLGQANTLVKILKYYPGVEVGGNVALSVDDNLDAMPNVRILLERDAFSGEGEVDLDNDTYWIPIGYTDADENGDWSYTQYLLVKSELLHLQESSTMLQQEMFSNLESMHLLSLIHI